MTKNGFKIPENYFDEFRNNLPEIIEHNAKEKKQNSIRIYYSIAASIIFIVASIFTFLPSSTTEENKLLSQELSDVEYYDIDMNDLYYAYSTDLNEQNSNDIDEENIIDYLSDESDLNELILLSE